MIDYVILCAGKGTRLKSFIPKPFVPIYGKSSTEYLLDLISEEPYLVLSPENVVYKKNLRGKIIIQEKPLGTAHAVECFLKEGTKSDYVFVLLGDMPLIKETSFKKFLTHRPKHYVLGVASLKNPQGYGRVFKTEKGFFTKSDQELSEEERNHSLISTGFCLINRKYLEEALPKIAFRGEEKPLPGIFKGNLEGELIEMEEEESLGINTPEEFQKVSEILRKRIIKFHEDQGVIFKDKEKVFIDSTVKIKPGVIIGSHVTLKGETFLESGVSIEDNLILEDKTIHENTHVTEEFLRNSNSYSF